MLRTPVRTVLVLALAALPALAQDTPPPSPAPLDTPADEQKRVDALERKAAMDRLNFSGEIRVANDWIDGTQAAYLDGMTLQKGVVDTMFYMQTNGGRFPMPSDPRDPRSVYRTLAGNVAAHYSEYLYFLSRLTFPDLRAAMGSFPPQAQQALMGMLVPGTARPARDYDNHVFYTTRLRLNMGAEVNDHFSFSGRLSMYKAWGDSTGVQVFNGLPNSINTDGTTGSVPNSDVVRVDRAYFDWKKIGDTGLYLSIGRRPSAGGPPLEVREGKLRGGTPLGHVVEYQFDGITAGYVFQDETLPGAVLRFCYGLGYESGYGSGAELKAPADRLKDVHFGGFNLDLYSTDRMFVQGTLLRAFDVTDGFNSLVVMPVDPVSGNPAPGPAPIRFSPTGNLGDIDLGALMVERHDGRVWSFVSGAYVKSHPAAVTGPFGGLFTDPFGTPRSQSGWSVYGGVRFDLPNDTTQIGAEFNHGSRYWFNFTHAADDVVLSKLATRGNAFEGYLNQKFGGAAQLRLSVIRYDYEHSGSGWHLGEPKRLADVPMLGFPTYRDVWNARLAFAVRF